MRAGVDAVRRSQVVLGTTHSTVRESPAAIEPMALVEVVPLRPSKFIPDGAARSHPPVPAPATLMTSPILQVEGSVRVTGVVALTTYPVSTCAAVLPVAATQLTETPVGPWTPAAPV